MKNSLIYAVAYLLSIHSNIKNPDKEYTLKNIITPLPVLSPESWKIKTLGSRLRSAPHQL